MIFRHASQFIMNLCPFLVILGACVNNFSLTFAMPFYDISISSKIDFAIFIVNFRFEMFCVNCSSKKPVVEKKLSAVAPSASVSTNSTSPSSLAAKPKTKLIPPRPRGMSTFVE